jgi:hypothetical protein
VTTVARRRTCSRTGIVVFLLVLAAAPARAEPYGWPQVGGLGTPVVLTYSFINLLDPAFQGLSEWQLRAATAQALGLWAQYAPLHFVERPDSGPPASDENYFADGHPELRIGAHGEDGLMLAHAFLPIDTETSGLAGDIHFNSESILPWGIEDGFPAIDFLEVMVHETGHALGLLHILDVDAIMNPNHGFRFRSGGAPFLLPADIEAIQAIYGAGVGSVSPIPEPSTFGLLGAGLVLAIIRRRRTAGKAVDAHP